VVTLRRLVFVAVLLVLMLLMGVFAYSNPEPIDVDVGLVRFERVPMAAAFAIVLTVGWLLGVSSAAVALWRSAGEKRRLKRDLQYAEAELRARQASP
jgi:hypothetical protein